MMIVTGTSPGNPGPSDDTLRLHNMREFENIN